MSVREYLSLLVDEDRRKAKKAPLLFLVGRTLGGASGVALLMLASDALNLSISPVAPRARIVLALSLGAGLAVRALWTARWRTPEPLANA